MRSEEGIGQRQLYQNLHQAARRFADRDDWSGGRAWFEFETAARPHDAEAWAHLAFFVVKESRYDTDRGLKHIAQALSLDPECGQAYVYQAMIFGCMLKEAPAREALDKARAHGAPHEDVLRTRAWMDLDLWRLDEAIRGFHDLVDVCPTSTSAVLLATAYLQASQHETALQWAHKAAATDPQDFRAPAYAGVALAYMGRHEEAREELTRASTLRADSPLVWHTLAWVACDESRLDEAERHLQKALQADPLYVTSRKMLADVCARGGRFDEARAHYEAALRQFPDYAAAREALQSLAK